MAADGDSSVMGRGWWPCVPPGHGGSLGDSDTALLSRGCLQGEDRAGAMGQGKPRCGEMPGCSLAVNSEAYQ